MAMKVYRSYNPNPQGRRVGDCAVRAVAVATGQSWDEAFYELSAQAYSMADMPSSDAVWGAYLRRRGFTKHILPASCPDCYTAAEFAEDHPRGVYVLAFGGHVATVRDGVLYDAWDSSALVPIYYWEKGYLK
ncbi:MAG: hypothetical protein II517_04155 [Ruminococcus sp.]|nr:hypothetical protein [Ruminococcus sp.]